MFKKLNQGIFIINVDGDLYLKSNRKKIRLTKGLTTEFGVPEIIEKGVPCHCYARILMDNNF